LRRNEQRNFFDYVPLQLCQTNLTTRLE
jgi:hypothetical protein